MSVKKEVGLILKGVGKGILSIVVPPAKTKKEDPHPDLHLHFNEKCRHYHRVD